MEPTSNSCCSSAPDGGAAPCSCSGPATMPGEIRTTDSVITSANRLDHVLARWGVNRMGHRVEPGLYRLGNPSPESPVFASANYTLSFDALRSALTGVDAYILVLDTKGINVWCAAGKGTFGTEELIRKIEATRLSLVVTHRRILVPQLGAPGISWMEVLRRSGFRVEFGPVRAADLPSYLTTHTATPAMRTVQFPLRDRIVLIPVELVQVIPWAVVATLVVGFFINWMTAAQVLTAVLAGTVLFPALLPYIPTKDFTTKGLVLGALVMLPFIWSGSTTGMSPSTLAGYAVTSLLVFPPVTAFLSLNFTGATTFTSRTGVRKEIFTYMRVMAGMFGVGIVLAAALFVIRAGVV
ncbi:MAG: mercury methylation corrinoid protein HgcA [Methanoregula sp.]|nr:mercury methylation corrinoid protein HgcA [Methanoregula sp.]